MIIELFEKLKVLLETNIVASGGLAVISFGIFTGFLWKIHYYIISLFEYLFFVEINFTSQDDSFLPIQNWLFNQSYTKKRCSNLMVKNIYRRRAGAAEDNEQQEQIFIPSYGTHYFCIGWRPTILNFTKSDTKDFQLLEYVNLRIFKFFNKFKFAEKIVEESTESFKKNKYEETFIYACIDTYSAWNFLLKKKIKQRPILETPTSYDELVQDIDKFFSSEDWYSERGINYKRGYLFTGTPGSGKSSTILSLAQHFKRHIYMLNLANNAIDDNKFIELVTSLPKDSFLAIEDIEGAAVGDNKSNNKDNKVVSLSTILNVLDGLLTTEKLIFFLSSNYPEKLNKSLVRPGRIDVIKNFNNANKFQAELIFKRFFPLSKESYLESFCKKAIGKSMSYLESHLIKNMDNIEKASRLE